MMTCFSTVAMAVAAGINGPVKKDVLHWFIRDTMSQVDGETNATGRIDARHAEQGRANHQRLEVFVQRLETNGAYHLLAWLGDDTNWTYVAPLAANSAGAIALRYRYNGTGNGRLGRPFTPLPDALIPVSQVRAVALANASAQAVLVADLTMPDKPQYLVKRAMNNDSVETNAEGLLRLRATPNDGWLHLQAWNLLAGTSYYLALDGNAKAALSVTADARGRLNVRLPQLDPLEVLNLRSVAVWNSESNSVLSVSLP